MNKPETKAWNDFRDAHLWILNQIHIVRVENSTGPGTPDVNICVKGQETWIENKVATPTGLVKFQVSQVPWLERRWACGGSVWILVFWRDAFVAFPGVAASKLAQEGCSETMRQFPTITIPEQFLDIVKFGRHGVFV